METIVLCLKAEGEACIGEECPIFMRCWPEMENIKITETDDPKAGIEKLERLWRVNESP